MSRLSRAAAATVGLLVLATAVAVAQEDAPLKAPQQRMEAFLSALVTFTSGVHLDERRFEAVLTNAASLETLKSGDEGDALAERAYHDGRYDFDVVVADPDYAAWARGHGLDPASFFKDFMRLQSLVMRQTIAMQTAMAKANLPQQRAQIEAMRQSLGEDGYRRAMRSIEAGQAMLERAQALGERIPEPNAAEAHLLEANAERIRAVMDTGSDPAGGPGEN